MFAFPNGSSLVAPYLNITCRDCGGEVSYEIHTKNNSTSVTSKVSDFISQNQQTNFEGQWLLAAMWKDLQPYSNAENAVSNSIFRSAVS